MPSAEKSTLVANTLDSTALNERSVENQQDEKVVSENSSTANYGVNSIVSIVSNKVRNLEKRKVSVVHVFRRRNTELMS